MSGEDFVSFLKRIKYPKASSLEKNSFDWMFENEATVPFLNRLCREIGESNVLSDDEIEQYQILENSGEGILENKQLEEALQSVFSSVEETMSEDQLREEIAQLESELQQSQKRKEALIQQRNQLSSHHASITDRQYKLGSLVNSAKSEYKQVLEESHADNAKLNDSLESLMSKVSEINELYDTSKPKVGKSMEEDLSPSTFFSHMPLATFYENEDKFTQVLTSYTKKLFFEGIADLAGEREGTRYEFLEIRKPDAALLKSSSEEVNFEQCKELTRLQAFTPKNEQSAINTTLREKGLEAALSLTERKLHALKDHPYPKEIKQLQERIQDSEKLLSVLQRDEEMYSKTELPQLIQDAAKYQISHILCGDYNLKIARQDYFTSNQDKIISELVSQKARHEYLTMAYEMEDKSHRETHRLLTALSILLKKNAQAWIDRMALLNDSALTPARHQRSTIDSRDEHLLRINKVLDPKLLDETRNQALFVTHDQLISRVTLLSEQVTSLTASKSGSHSSNNLRLGQLEGCLSSTEDLVYTGTTSGEPVLSPSAITNAISQLENLVQKLEQSILSIMKDVNQKKEILKTDPLQLIERELFVYYQTDQSYLRRVIDDLEARLNAQTLT